MLRDDAVGEGEADAVAFGFRGEKRDEDLLQIGCCDPRAAVAHLYHDTAIFPCRSHNDMAIRSGFSAVAHEIK